MRAHPLQTLSDVSEETYEILLPVGRFALGFLAVYLVGRAVVEPAVREFVHRRNRNNPTIQQAVEHYTRLFVLVVATFVAIVTAGFGHVLTGSALVIAAATLAIGVAAQEVLAALVSGLFLVANPDFSVGDWISWDDREGVVEAINFRTTRIRTPDNETVVVPNTELTTRAITRPYAREQFRANTTVGVDYDDDVGTALSTLRTAADATPAVLDEPEPRAYLVEFGEDAVLLRLQYWIRDPTRRHFLRTRSTLAREIKTRFEDAGLTLSPASQRELSGHVRAEPSEERPS